MDALEDEVRRLRRCLRDVVAMTMLPSVWTGYDAAHIFNDLVDVVIRTVDADGVLLTVSGRSSFDILRLQDEANPHLPGLLREWATAPAAGDATVTSGGRQLRLLSYPLIAGSEDRLVAASYRPDFPNESERLLLRVAANHLAMWIERTNAERSSRFFAEAGETLGSSLDYEGTLRAITSLAVPQLADWCFIDLGEPDGSFERVAVGHWNPADAPIARRLRRSYAAKNAPYAVSRSFVEGITVLKNAVTPEFLIPFARDEDHREAILAVGIRAFVSVPMKSRGKTFGVMTFLGTTRKTRFDAADVAIAEELTRRAGLAIDNARLYREAQEANRAKDEFLANLSHELRTPMTAILGWAHLLHLGGIDEAEVRLGIDTIRQSGLAQAKLIDELLDVSRIITGKMHLTTASVAVPDIVRAAVTAIRPAAEARRQQLELDTTDDDLHVIGDAGRLQQVFWNLLSNAVKFTPAGGSIRVRVAREGTSSVKVMVTDTGEGIAVDLLPHVFERFRQVTQVVGRRSGLGLGLAIARELVELHGGTITAQSAGVNGGSTFVVTLPLETAEEHAGSAGILAGSSRQRLHALRVLLVEDDETTRTLLDTLLRSYGAEVVATSSAADARIALASFSPDILISDIEMPGDDGVALLQSLRGHGERMFPAIAVTGYADESNRHRVLAAGFDGFVPKPLDPAALADEIERTVGLRGTGTE